MHTHKTIQWFTNLHTSLIFWSQGRDGADGDPGDPGPAVRLWLGKQLPGDKILSVTAVF